MPAPVSCSLAVQHSLMCECLCILTDSIYGYSVLHPVAMTLVAHFCQLVQGLEHDSVGRD